MVKKYIHSNCTWEQLHLYIFNLRQRRTSIYFNSGSNNNYLSNKIFALLFSNIYSIMITKERQSMFEIMLFGMKLSLRVSIANIVKMTKGCTIKKLKPESSQQKQSESRKKKNSTHLHVIPKDKILIMTFCTLNSCYR